MTINISSFHRENDKTIESDSFFISGLLATACELITNEDMPSVSKRVSVDSHYSHPFTKDYVLAGSPRMDRRHYRLSHSDRLARLATLPSTCYFVLSQNGISHIV